LKEVLGQDEYLYYVPEEARVQDQKNRQNSIFANDGRLDDNMQNTMMSAYKVADMAYQELLKQGIAKEIARLVLPQGGFTRLYVTGSVRSWMTYLKVRDEPGVVQHEHVELAQAIKTIFATQFPTVYDAYFNPDPDPRDKVIEEQNRELKDLQRIIENLVIDFSGNDS
jgi:flavin-dependent thymidylate synthase